MMTWIKKMTKSIEVYEVHNNISTLYILIESCDRNMNFIGTQNSIILEILFYVICFEKSN